MGLDMKSEKKIDMLIELENKSKLTDKQLKEIIEMSNDPHFLVRSQVATLLVNFKNDISKEILLRLSCDENALVRVEAYDSLSVFNYDDVEICLREAIQKEKNKLACCYAILSWADVVAALGKKTTENLSLITEIKNSSRIKQSEHCLLSCSYAIYILGINKSMDDIIAFLNSSNYQVRCAAISILKCIANNDNKEIIRKALIRTLKTETVTSVKKNIKAFLKNLKV